jgi:hypothetical protein
MAKMTEDKKGQISEGITWIVATTAIIIILLISIFVTSLSASGNSEVRGDYLSPNIAQKSFFSYLLTKESGRTIYSDIKENEKINNADGNLALKVFNGLYKKDYSKIWFGISELRAGTANRLNGLKNEFFGDKPLEATGLRTDYNTFWDYSIISVAIKFSDQKFLEAVFVK